MLYGTKAKGSQAGLIINISRKRIIWDTIRKPGLTSSVGSTETQDVAKKKRRFLKSATFFAVKNNPLISCATL